MIFFYRVRISLRKNVSFLTKKNRNLIEHYVSKTDDHSVFSKNDSSLIIRLYSLYYEIIFFRNLIKISALISF